MQVNDKVRLLKDIWEDADDHSPGGYLAKTGETLIVRRLTPDNQRYKCFVSHASITNNDFGVLADEIELIKDAP